MGISIRSLPVLTIAAAALMLGCNAGGRMYPVAQAHATPNPQTAGETVHLYGLDSYDPDCGEIILYQWDLNEDGRYDLCGSHVTHVWDVPGLYRVQLRVTDNDGVTDTLDEPLEVRIVEPPPHNLIVQVSMRLRGAINPDFFYYIVFNNSGDPAAKPWSVFDGEDRGKNWSLYYMYGSPPTRATDLYRGAGGLGGEGENLVDQPPLDRASIPELLPGTIVEDDRITLRIDLGGPDFQSLNMNMIVCNQAIDAESKVSYEFDPYVFDSFYDNGITLDPTEGITQWSESTHPQEQIPNEYENTAPASADIVDWVFQIVES
jgi:hypothetical protein